MMQSAPVQHKNAAENPAKAYANQLLVIMDELTKLMEEETPLILARDYDHQNEFIRRKQELTLNYQSVMKVFAENAEMLKALSKDDVGILRSQGKKLDELTQRNAIALRNAHHANENLLKVIINEIRRDLQKESGYSGRGVMALAESAQARPVSFSQKI